MNDIDLSAAHVTSRHLAEFDRAGGYRFFHRSGEEAKAVVPVVPSLPIALLQNPATGNSGTCAIHSNEFPPIHLEVPGTLVEPLTATQSRIHLTVSRDLLAKLRKARHAQSHVQPGATDEQVLFAPIVREPWVHYCSMVGTVPLTTGISQAA